MNKKITILLITFLTIIAFNELAYAQQPAVKTCLLNNEGTWCMQYDAQTCDSQCTSSCFPGTRESYSECTTGTCFDPNEGICNTGSPKGRCESQNGVWSQTTPSECNQGCCLIDPDTNGMASQTQFSTHRECEILGENLGASRVEWNGQISSERACHNMRATNTQGACVLDLDSSNRYNCRFTTENECINNLQGVFHADKLCTNSQLNTNCEKTTNTQCFEGKDGVYFVDSCNQRANIYDSTKINVQDYWDDVARIEQICHLSSGNDRFFNQAKCGNCDYLQGSVCGTPSAIDSSANSGQNVCKNLDCVEEDGTRRKHGSSWCVYEGKIGLDGEDGTNAQRAVSVVGSSQYKKSCFKGKIRTEGCTDYRTNICVESGDELSGNTTARCIANNAGSCFDYNEDVETLAECETNPLCFLKHVGIDDFRFDICVPKYPLGFEFEKQESDGSIKENQLAKSTCDLASLTCNYQEIKDIDGDWECERNCACNSPDFVEAMNNLCMGLGDCGGKINLAGEYTKNYRVSGDRNPVATSAYINALSSFLNPVLGQRIEPVVGLENENARQLNLNFPERGFLDKLVASIEGYISAGGFMIGFDPMIAIWAPILGIGDDRTGSVIFTCLPWEPPAGGDDCSKCNDLGLNNSCTEYKCRSLGKSCELLNKDNPQDAVCIDNNPGDSSYPVISFDSNSLTSGLNYVESSSGLGVEIKNNSNPNGCLKEGTRINFGIITSEPAECMKSLEAVPYEQMNLEFDREGYLTKHNTTTRMPSLDELGVSGIRPDRRGNYNIYVKCSDRPGNYNEAEYAVRFCVMPGEDTSPPEIDDFEPPSPAITGLNAENLNVKFYTDEPAECRFSSIDEDYSTMPNSILCRNSWADEEFYGWPCYPIVNLSENINKYYFRCLDKPWLSNEDTNRNVNRQSVEYEIQKTETALTVSYLSPNGTTIVVGGEPVSVSFEARTSGGIDNGNALCRYKLDDFRGTFSQTDSSTHKQTWTTLYGGEHTVEVSCTDRARNTANSTAIFSIGVDNVGPTITRVYNAGTNLKVVTNERSVCAYSVSDCLFEFSNGTLLSGSEKVHTMRYATGLSYNVKCRDIFRNEGNCIRVSNGYG